MKKGKRLNNKGFTLIELLAVIVILALVMGLSANSVLNAINNSRKSSLYSTAQAAANSLNNWATEDSVVTDSSEKTLTDDFVKYTQTTKRNEWVCIDNANLKIKTSVASNLYLALGLKESDIIISGTEPTKDGTPAVYSVKEEQSPESNNTCSAIRYNTDVGGVYEVLLVAKRNGKFFVSANDSHYAFNRADGPNLLITD